MNPLNIGRQESNTTIFMPQINQLVTWDTYVTHVTM